MYDTFSMVFISVVSLWFKMLEGAYSTARNNLKSYPFIPTLPKLPNDSSLPSNLRTTLTDSKNFAWVQKVIYPVVVVCKLVADVLKDYLIKFLLGRNIETKKDPDVGTEKGYRTGVSWMELGMNLYRSWEDIESKEKIERTDKGPWSVASSFQCLASSFTFPSKIILGCIAVSFQIMLFNLPSNHSGYYGNTEFVQLNQ